MQCCKIIIFRYTLNLCGFYGLELQWNQMSRNINQININTQSKFHKSTCPLKRIKMYTSQNKGVYSKSTLKLSGCYSFKDTLGSLSKLFWHNFLILYKFSSLGCTYGCKSGVSILLLSFTHNHRQGCNCHYTAQTRSQSLETFTLNLYIDRCAVTISGTIKMVKSKGHEDIAQRL